MKKLFEIDLNEDYRNSRFSQFVLMALTFILSAAVRIHEKNFVELNFLLEIFIIGAVFNAYFKAQKQRNYSFWGISFLLGLFLLQNVVKYTFEDYQIFILYIAFLAGIFLTINCYIMSSPLFFPRVQWWEYDFRYRGDLKSFIKLKDEVIESRVTDLRRECACVESFNRIDLGSEFELEMEHEDKNYVIPAIVKTSKEVIKGRPIRYGIEFDLEDEKNKAQYDDLKEIWASNKKAKIRTKFKDLKERNGN